MNHEQALPFSKEPIFVDWRRPDIGGLRVSAWTDASGNPYIGIFTLNREGHALGVPCWYERQRFLSYTVIGFDKQEAPVKVFLEAEVTYRGLHVALQLPWEPLTAYFYHRKLFARWESDAPAFGFFVNPSNNDAIADSYLPQDI